MEEEKVENSNLEEVMKDSTLNNPDLTFCEKTTYLDFLLSNAQNEEEADEIKKSINDFLEISKEDETEVIVEEEKKEDEDEVEIEQIDSKSFDDLESDDEEDEDEFDDEDFDTDEDEREDLDDLDDSFEDEGEESDGKLED